MPNKSIHVVPSGGRWKVKSSGASKAYRSFDNKKAAISQGVVVGRNRKTELYIHKADGTIQEKRSYGNDPCPPKDKK